MKRILLVLFCVAMALACVSCDQSAPKSKNKKASEPVASYYVGTLGDYFVEKDPDIELLKLEDIYFPDGLFDTGLGLYIWDTQNKRWVRTNTEEGKSLFRPDKSVLSFAHGKGGNATADCPDFYYNNGYNVLSFMWGTFARERDAEWYVIADKIWYRECTRWILDPSNDDESDNNFEFTDIPNASVTEIYGALYYDLFSAFPEYSGAETMICGHSYGGMLTGAMISFLCSQYEAGNIPAYMLPSKVCFLDPYFSGTNETRYDVPWLTDRLENGNDNEAIYQAILKCRELGIAVGLDRTDKAVCWPTTMNEFGTDITGSYWNFCNNLVYAHISDNCTEDFSNYRAEIHGYGWDWFTMHNTGYILKDSSATVEEEAYCFFMPYEKMFAKAGIKYDFDINGTQNNIEDDIVVSFFCEYNTEINDALENESEEILETYTTGKAKIVGFAFVDRNGNGKLDEGVKDHFAGITVTVKDAEGNVLYSEVTGLNGYYEVETDKAGEYTVTFEAPRGYGISAEEDRVTIIDTERQVAVNNVIVTAE